jgi:hypothetical protein
MLPSEQPQDPALLSDSDLTAAVTALARTARETTASLIRHLVEFESRRLHLAAGFGSLFIYCVQVLHLSEHEAYNRIEAARVAGKHPIILDMLARGDLNLTSVRLLGPHLTDANHLALLRDAAGKSKREVLAVIARHFPRPDVPDSVRKVPSRDGAPVLSVAPLARIAGAPSMAAYGHRGEALEAPSGLGSAAVGGRRSGGTGRSGILSGPPGVHAAAGAGPLRDPVHCIGGDVREAPSGKRPSPARERCRGHGRYRGSRADAAASGPGAEEVRRHSAPAGDSTRGPRRAEHPGRRQTRSMAPRSGSLRVRRQRPALRGARFSGVPSCPSVWRGWRGDDREHRGSLPGAQPL